MPEFSSSKDLQVELTYGQKFMKYLIVFFNVVFLIFAIVLIAVGSYAMKSNVMTLYGGSLPVGIIILGVFLLVMSFMGCASAWKEFRLGLGAYFMLLLVFSIILVSVGIAVVVEKDKASQFMTDGWNQSGADLKNVIQTSFNCCGLKTYNSTEYVGSTCPVGTNQPCLPIVSQVFYDNFNTAGSCGIAFACVQLVTLIFICYLMRGIRSVTVNQQIMKNREKTVKDKEKKGGKGGMKFQV